MGLCVLVLISRRDYLLFGLWILVLIGEMHGTMDISTDLKGDFGTLGTSTDL